ncbi:MAG: serine/threonine protein kinase [Planctomycetes bacterium]|nr:serine/threonine protein kinase [Planctomycetota bacterium]
MSVPVVQPNWEAFYANHRTPSFVPGFQITKQLRSDANGVVCMAERQSTGRTYAINFLQFCDAQVQLVVQRDLAQARYFVMLDHSNLVSIEEHGVVVGIPYLVTAFAGQETLRFCIGKPELREVAIGYLQQACRGIAALHQRGFAHFHLQPENVFIEGAIARVSDFWLSKVPAPGSEQSSGMPIAQHYMAPEVLAGRSDCRSDIYSIGVMLFEVLTNHTPFVGATALAMLQQCAQGKLDLPTELCTSDRAVLLRCLAVQPEQRFASVDDLLTAWRVPAQKTAAAAVFGSASAAPLSRSAPVAIAPLPSPLPSPSSTTPPPLPSPSSTTPPPLPSFSSRQKRSATKAVLVVVAGIFGLFYAALAAESQSVSRHQREPRRSPSVGTVHGADSAAGSDPREVIRGILQSGERPGRSADSELRPLDPQKVKLPEDLALYNDQLAQLFDPEMIRAGGAYQRLGYPFFLAAVEWLQEQDYRFAKACRHASAIHLVLQHVTAVQGLAQAPPQVAVDAEVSRRFILAAVAWRELAEGQCADEVAFRTFLQSTGKLPLDLRKN